MEKRRRLEKGEVDESVATRENLEKIEGKEPRDEGAGAGKRKKKFRGKKPEIFPSAKWFDLDSWG